jgi:hypothetical protein
MLVGVLYSWAIRNRVRPEWFAAEREKIQKLLAVFLSPDLVIRKKKKVLIWCQCHMPLRHAARSTKRANWKNLTNG